MSAMDYSKVADLYDIYAQTDLDVPFFLQESRGCRNVLELTSGTGRLSLPLIEAGVHLSCLDNSPEMLAILHKKLQSKRLSVPVYQMDICHLTLPEQFDLIIIPFNAFSEIIDPVAQRAALTSIHSQLADAGQLICTLHNPAIRLKIIDGQIHFRGNFAIPGNAGTLVLSSVESYDASTHLVKGAQFYELYNPDGILQSKRLVGIQFFVHFRETFETLIRSQGYKVMALYGDYERIEFQPERSPFMIWVLGKR
jgi:SAM-dependent methyltransferase